MPPAGPAGVKIRIIAFGDYINNSGSAEPVSPPSEENAAPLRGEVLKSVDFSTLKPEINLRFIL